MFGNNCAESGGVRPFGVSLMLAGYDSHGPQLYQIDPSGTFFAWKASAIGKNMVNAKTFLEKRYAEDLELEDAIDTALLTLKESFEGEMSGDNIEARIATHLFLPGGVRNTPFYVPFSLSNHTLRVV
jgi:20S proteasome subunit alpha 2